MMSKRRLARRRKPRHLPSNREVREHVLRLAESFDGDARLERLRRMGEPPGTAQESQRILKRDSLRLLLASLAGDQLCHSLRVFDLARRAYPDDVELAQAALLHDVGKAIDDRDHAYAGARAISGLVSERVVWLVEQQTDAAALLEGTLGRRRTRRLREDARFDDLMALRVFDTEGRSPGELVPDVDEALDFVLAGLPLP